MQLGWITEFKDGGRITLDTVKLDTISASGVYVIYQLGNPGKVVYVGKGGVADRLGCHRDDARFNAHRAKSTLYVAFASVAAASQEGVEKYLAVRFQPLVGERHPDVPEIAVNSPFAA